MLFKINISSGIYITFIPILKSIVKLIKVMKQINIFSNCNVRKKNVQVQK